MANYAARQLNVTKTFIKFEDEYYNNVGFAQKFIGERGNDCYSGPQWFTENAKDMYSSY
jgi:hypothetical protein